MESFQGVEMKTPAEDCLDQATKICLERSLQRLASSSGPQVHRLQCEYVVGKLKTAVECVQECFKYLAVEEIQNYHHICKLLLQAAMNVKSIVSDCCKSRWILAAVLLPDSTQHFASLAYELEMCTRLMHSSWRRIGATQTLRELREVKNVETNRLIDMVVRDRKALLEKLAGCQAQSTIKERDLAEQLMKRIQNAGKMTYGHVVDDHVKCWHLLDSKSLERLGSLGKGVDKVKWRGEHFALKTFFGSEHQTFMNEVSILAGLSHPNIVSLVGFIINTRNRSSSILLELMDQDLYHYMQEKLANDDSDGVPFSHIEATDIMLQIAEGVQYLHENKIVHRDLKSFNIMINRVRRRGVHEHLQVKVADFGHSKLKQNSHTYSNQTPNIGTTRWMAPELFCRKSTTRSLQSGAMEIPEAKHPFKTDVYSFAMVCVEILTGDVPFSTNVALGGLRESIVDGLRPELPWNQWPERLCALIEKCWVFDPIERPSFATIVSELKSIKWSLALVIRKGPSPMLGWNLLANRLENLESLQNLLAPTNILVGLMGEIARLTYNMLEANRASKENQVLVEQLSECTYALFRKLECYILEPRNKPKEKLFPKFLCNFQETMKNVLGFVRKFSVPHYIVLHIDVKSQFSNLRQHLDVVEVDFKFHMLRKLCFKYKPIGHWRLGEMWKPGLGNVIKAKWARFWDQMMLDFPSTSQFLLGPSATENKAKLEAKVIACMLNTFPWDIESNNICSCASIEEILINLLAANEHDPVVIAMEASHEQNQINTSTADVAKEVISWNGYFMNSSGTKGDMKAELFITSVHNIYGGGSDDIGDFTWTGCCQDTQANIIKHYIDQHKLKYDGVMEGANITGTWRFLFSHSMGEFFLEPQPYKSNGRVAQFVEAGKIKCWEGYFREDNKISHMSAQIIFTENGSIYSTGGKDNMGSFNLLGRYYLEYNSVSLSMVKQPRVGMPTVYFWGVMAKEESSSDVVIEGSWVYWNQMGTFRLVARAFP